METAQRIALTLIIIGAFNWGLVGLFQFNIVEVLAGGSSEALARFIYIIIGISGLINLTLLFEGWKNHQLIKVQRTELKKPSPEQ